MTVKMLSSAYEFSVVSCATCLNLGLPFAGACVVRLFGRFCSFCKHRRQCSLRDPETTNRTCMMMQEVLAPE